MTDDDVFSRPKVMLIDTTSQALQRVHSAGYNVVGGALGRPLKVPAQAGYIPVSPNAHLPGFAEQEVVVVQQRAPEPVDATPDDQPTVTDKTRVWGSTAEGIIDVRPWAAAGWSDDAGRILRHGGVFICFCEPPRSSGLVRANPPSAYGQSLYVENELPWSVWDLLGLTSLHVEFDHGREITPVSIELLDVLAPHLKTATFNCTLEPSQHRRERWIALAHNKYGKPVAGMCAVECQGFTEDEPKDA